MMIIVMVLAVCVATLGVLHGTEFWDRQGARIRRARDRRLTRWRAAQVKQQEEFIMFITTALVEVIKAKRPEGDKQADGKPCSTITWSVRNDIVEKDHYHVSLVLNANIQGIAGADYAGILGMKRAARLLDGMEISEDEGSGYTVLFRREQLPKRVGYTALSKERMTFRKAFGKEGRLIVGSDRSFITLLL